MTQALKEAFKNWIAYLRKPNDATIEDLTVDSKLKLTALMFLIELPFVLVFSILFSLIEHYKLMDTGPNKIVDLVGELSYIQIILILVLFIPFIEELIFRLPLKYKRYYLLRCLVWIVSQTGLIKQDKLNESVQRYWQRYFGSFFYIMAFVFGFIHLTNFEKAKELIFIMPLITLTQCLGGLIIGYLRVKLGFLWGYLYHLSFNFIFFTLGFVSIQSDNSTLYSALPYHYTDENISIDIEKSKFDLKYNKVQSGYLVTPENIEYHDFKIDNLISSLHFKNIKYIKTGSLKFNSKDIIDIHLILKTQQMNTDSARYLTELHLQKALGIKIETCSIQKDAWLLYVIDSTKLQNDSSKKDLIQINGNLKKVGRYLDRTFENQYIYSADTLHNTAVIMPISNKFEDLPAYLEKEYGIGLKKVKKELEFIDIKWAETSESAN